MPKSHISRLIISDCSECDLPQASTLSRLHALMPESWRMEFSPSSSSDIKSRCKSGFYVIRALSVLDCSRLLKMKKPAPTRDASFFTKHCAVDTGQDTSYANDVSIGIGGTKDQSPKFHRVSSVRVPRADYSRRAATEPPESESPRPSALTSTRRLPRPKSTITTNRHDSPPHSGVLTS